MSAFLVENETIDRIVTKLRVMADRDEYLPKALFEIGYNLKTVEDVHRLGKDMFELNCKALDARYNDKREMFGDYKYKFNGCNTKVSVMKAIDCWLYQCCEGDIPETSLLYNTMKHISRELAHDIVMDSAEYDQAKWG